MPHFPDEIEYSEKYQDDYFEYRHVLLPKALFKRIPRGKLLPEQEWRSFGVQQSRGWVHYEVHKPEPFILLFRRPLGTDPQTGLPPNTHPYYDVHVTMMKNPNAASDA
jgi:cyclin-dependent kinase regulatory subunit CKS1